MIEFRMKGIAVEQFAILKDNPPQNHNQIRINSEIGFEGSVEKSIIGCRLNLSFEENDEKFIVLKIMCTFEINTNSWNSMIEDNTLTLPKDFLQHIAVHTVGTARGILFSKTESTPFNIYILPPINVEKIINEDLKVSVEEQNA